MIIDIKAIIYNNVYLKIKTQTTYISMTKTKDKFAKINDSVKRCVTYNKRMKSMIKKAI